MIHITTIPGSTPFAYFILAGILLISCRVTSQSIPNPDNFLNKIWNDLNLPAIEHTGLYIEDLESGKPVFNFNEENYFTPGSNIKILTMYAALRTLEDSIEAGRYSIYGDSLVLWGGGDPGTKYPKIDSSSALVDFIMQSDKKVFFSNSHFRSERFGKGWMWDDYLYNYQCERNAFPLYGNRMWINRIQDTITITPQYLAPNVAIVTDTFNKVVKTEWGEDYTYTYNEKQELDHREIPITFFRNDIQYVWSEATGKPIVMLDKVLPDTVISIIGSSRDTLLKRMMQESDNFIAEQLLLACSMNKLNYMSDEIFIDSMMEGLVKEIADEIEWVDGSGLSRYNQATPTSMVWTLKQIYSFGGLSYIKSIFPAGGVSGSIKDAYKGMNGIPYIYAKSGTMRQVSCISGFLLTRSGKILVFSWMNNQFKGSSIDIRKKMEKLFSFLYDQY